jgi:hypothetical protein
MHVSYRISHQHGPLIEQPGVAPGVQPATRFAVADRIRFELRPLAVHERLAAEEDRLAVALDDQRVGDVLRDPVPVEPKE